jgi:hypothetical protein
MTEVCGITSEQGEAMEAEAIAESRRLRRRVGVLCPRCGERTTFEKEQRGTGWVVWTAKCCGEYPNPHRRQVPAAHFFRPGEIESMPDRVTVNPGTCVVCGAIGYVERHHTAPQAIFGDEAARWPIIEVCHACHVRYHQTMTDWVAGKAEVFNA